MPILEAVSSSSAWRGRDRAREAAFVIAFGSARAVFLYGFAKNERENIQDAELMTLREIAATFLDASQ